MSSVWLQQALNAEGQSHSIQLDESQSVDVCIVGGGFTGLWTAYELKQRHPELDIVLIEKHICGAGASGANAGYAVSLWIQLQLLEKVCGTEEALRLCHASEAVIDEISALSNKHQIDTQLRRTGAIWGATCEAQSGHWDSAIDLLQKHQIHHLQRLSQAEIENLTGTSSHVAGVFDKGTTLLHPGHLVRGLRRLVIALGVRIYENTAMIRLIRSQPPKIVTPSGTITASKVVLGMYGWSLGISELSPGAMVIFSDALMSEPIPDKLSRLGGSDAPALMDSRIFVQAQRTTADGRIMWTKAGGALPFKDRLESHTSKPYRSIDEMRAELEKIYPTLRDIKIAGSWAGPIDRTKDGLPMFGPLSTCPDVYYGYGYSGSGIILSRLGSKILASLVSETKDEWARSGLVRAVGKAFPSEPFRYIGSRFVRAAIERKDNLDHIGRRVGPLTQFWLRFKPSSYKPS